MQLKAQTYAKLNITLNVTKKRADGYHELESIMQSVSLFDTVTVSTNKKGIITVKTDNKKLSDEENIAKIAAEAYFSAAKLDDGADIVIEKRIPLSAGLGGGSADAAAVLTLLNKCYGALSEETLKEVALSVGADVPFCMSGGTAYVSGIGENIKKQADLPKCYILICKNAQKSSTKDVYAAIDRFALKKDDRNKVAQTAVNNGDLKGLCKASFNDFSMVVKESGIETVMNILENTNALCIGMSGAGPTVFAVFEEKEDADEIYKIFKPSAQFVAVCEPVPYGVEIID